jgi:hypothetical protein
MNKKQSGKKKDPPKKLRGGLNNSPKSNLSCAEVQLFLGIMLLLKEIERKKKKKKERKGVSWGDGG